MATTSAADIPGMWELIHGEMGGQWSTNPNVVLVIDREYRFEVLMDGLVQQGGRISYNRWSGRILFTDQAGSDFAGLADVSHQVMAYAVALPGTIPPLTWANAKAANVVLNVYLRVGTRSQANG